MHHVLISVLLVEDNSTDASLIQASLTGTGNGPFQIEWVTRLSDALARLNQGGIEVILFDLSLPDSEGIEAFDQVFRAAPSALILVLSGASDEEAAHQAVQRGAHDYFIKNHIDAHWLPRALHYLIERKATRAALRNSEARFRAMSDGSPLGIFVSDAQGRCVYTNAAYHKISGQTFEQTLGTHWGSSIHPDDRQRVLGEWRDAAVEDEVFQSEIRFVREDGSVVWTSVNDATMHDGAERFGHVQTVEDISERKAAEQVLRAAEDALFEEKERAQVTLNSIGDAVLTTDNRGNVTYLNLAAETMTGWSQEDAADRPLPDVFKIINGLTRQPLENPARIAIDENRPVGLVKDCVLIHRDGGESAIEDSTAPIHNREGLVDGAVIVFHDVSEARAMTRQMLHLAHHDFLTDLPNRVLLTERLSQSIGLGQRHRKQVGLLFLDLDNFKHINDSLGHGIGDLLLQSVASRLQTCVRSTDTVCRQGGDEFVILLAEIERPQDASQVAEKLMAAFAIPHQVGGHELHVTLSIGISIYPEDGGNVDNMMQNADTAMYHAKTCGRNNYQFFRQDMNTRAVHRLFIENSLRRALAQNEFLLYYQPQVDLVSGEMTGAEALIRWLDPDLGLVYPGHFIPVAEECGLIVPLGQWVLREACRQIKTWLDEGLNVVPVAINVSAVEFRQPDFLSGLAQILQETGVAPHYLELELTESILMQDADASVQVLEALKALGVQLAIDDFGMGYSSLSYLKRFPIDTLKIDQSFVRDISTNEDDAAIVNAVISMGKNLKQRVIAEGVENAAQLAILQEQDCAQGQGFLFDRPMDAEDFTRLLRGENPKESGRKFI